MWLRYGNVSTGTMLRSEHRFLADQKFSLHQPSRPILVTPHPPIQWLTVNLSPKVKWPGRQAGRSPPSSFKVKNMWQYVFTPYILWRNESTMATLYFYRLVSWYRILNGK